MLETNEIKEPTTEITETPTKEELIKRFAIVQNISFEEAKSQIDSDDIEGVLKNIQAKTLERIRAYNPPMNRAQRRALEKKVGSKKYAEMIAENGDVVEAVSETAKKLNYISLIEKLKELNAKKENEDYGETTIEDN